MKLKTEKPKPFVCAKCQASFTRYENLVRHEQKHTNQKFACPICQTNFTRKDSVKTHIQKYHPESLQQVAGSSNEDSIINLSKKPAVKSPPQQPLAVSVSSLASPLNELETAQINTMLRNYWENLHLGLPIVHKGSFALAMEYNSDPLTNMICSIGSRYSPDLKHLSYPLYAYTLKLLDNMNQDEIYQTRNTQAFVLAIYSGIFDGEMESFKRAKSDLTNILLIARESGLFQNDFVTYRNHAEVNEWENFISMEVRRRLSYSLYFIDAQLSTLMNYPPGMSHYEIKHVLPCSDELWEAKDELEWSIIKAKETHKEVYFLEVVQHTLIYGKPLLPISSFGATIIVNYIHIMIRNTTQFAGLLETVPVFANDPFSRRSQLGNALNGLRVLIPKKKLNHNQPLKTMWDVFECNWNLAYIHLHLPDTVITSGIVEVTLEAAIATAAMVAKSQQRQPPGIALLKNDFNEIPYQTHSLVASHLSFFLKYFKPDFKETNPSLTFIFFKVCLIAWQILNVSINNKDENDKLDPMEYSSTRLNVQEERDKLQKKYMMERLSCDILSNIESCVDYTSIEFYENWCESLLKSFNIWGIGKCAAESFSEMHNPSL